MNYSLFLHWRSNLVGSQGAYFINFLLTILGGSLYTFNLVKSPIMLLAFGVVSPVIFTLCAYASIGYLKNQIDKPEFPNILFSRYGSFLAMTLDLFLIGALAALIHFNVLNYLFFRFLQTVFLPMVSLSLLRFLHIVSQMNEK